MKTDASIRPSESLEHVRYEIRGRLARRAHELERQGYEIIKLNIGNPRAFGFRTPGDHAAGDDREPRAGRGLLPPEGHLPGARGGGDAAPGAGHPRGQRRGRVHGQRGVRAHPRACGRSSTSGDEVLVPSPDYPLWTAAVTLNGGRAVHYPCRPENGFVPDPRGGRAPGHAADARYRPHQPQQPDRRRLPAPMLEALVRVAEQHRPGPLQRRDLRPHALRRRRARAHRHAVRTRSAPRSRALQGVSRLRLPGGLGGVLRPQARAAPITWRGSSCSPRSASAPTCRAMGGADGARRLAEHAGASPRAAGCTSRARAILGVERSRFLTLVPPRGAMYAFVGVDPRELPDFDDSSSRSICWSRSTCWWSPGASFNVPYRNHFRLTILPDAATLARGLRAHRGAARELCGTHTCGCAGHGDPQCHTVRLAL